MPLPHYKEPVADLQHLIQIRRYYNLGRKSGYIPPVCPLDKFVSGVLLLHWHLTGEELSAARLWKRNQQNYTATMNLQNRISQDILNGRKARVCITLMSRNCGNWTALKRAISRL